jgi:hypothetical protein
MAKGLFAKIIKAVSIGGGTILSLLGFGAVGIPLIAAGSKVNTDSSDAVSNASQTISPGLTLSINPQTGTTSTTNVNSIIDWFKTNPIVLLILGVGVALLLFRGLFHKK